MQWNFRFALTVIALGALTGCTFNPFQTNQQLTGNVAGAGIGAAAGAGTAALLGATKPAPLIAGGLIGGIVGYYVTTLQFDSAGVTQAGGQVFTLGDFATVDIPSDHIFEVNTDEFTETAGPILDSTVAVLNRYPNNNIIISANTSGFGTTQWERRLSENRARQISAYLWAHGISEFKSQSLQTRKLTYVGYGNYFPIANNLHNDSIRQNSHIQISSYPSASELEMDKCVRRFNNIGALDAAPTYKGEQANFGNAYSTEFREKGNARMGYNEGKINNSILALAPPRKPIPKEDDVWGNYNNPTNEPQTTSGESVEKQGGFVGFKGEV